MSARTRFLPLFAAGLLLVPAALVGQTRPPLRPLAPIPPGNLWVSPSMEGWYDNEDGTYTISFGFNNRNSDEVVHIPVGEDNFIEPAEFNGLQPEVFRPGHVRGVFGVTIPEEMRDQDIVWTLRNQGRTLVVPGRTSSSAYQLDWRPRPQGSLPPVIRFRDGGPTGMGPGGLRAEEVVEATVGEPVELSVWARDDSERDPDDFRAWDVPVTLNWYLFQGDGEVTFDSPQAAERMAASEGADDRGAADADPDMTEEFEVGPHQVVIEEAEGWGTIFATFSEPGEYILRVQAENFEAIDSAESQQCCWTNGYVTVVVEQP